MTDAFKFAILATPDDAGGTMDWDIREGLSSTMFGLVFFLMLLGGISLFGGGSESEPRPTSTYEEPATADIQQVAPVQQYSNWSWDNCAEARGAGAAPVYAGEAGYGSQLDRDGDGVGCE
ncbi:hypothetical protein GCM10009784_08120 [Arthrobacter parietis]|uniref:Excalibur calcium-binding domain-containing protein n=1 Tax=Arthrobacter parietis TaxID=271434 RepID=A0ABP5MFY1_9MICC